MQLKPPPKEKFFSTKTAFKGSPRHLSTMKMSTMVSINWLFQSFISSKLSSKLKWSVPARIWKRCASVLGKNSQLLGGLLSPLRLRFFTSLKNDGWRPETYYRFFKVSQLCHPYPPRTTLWFCHFSPVAYTPPHAYPPCENSENVRSSNNTSWRCAFLANISVVRASETKQLLCTKIWFSHMSMM